MEEPNAIEPLGEAVDRRWAGRILGVAWLASGAAIGWTGFGHPVLTAVVVASVGVVGAVLVLGRGRLSRGSLDAVLFATTTLMGVLAFALPGRSWTLAPYVLLTVPFACALLPQLRMLLQVGYGVAVGGAVMVTSLRAGEVTATLGGLHWLLVTSAVIAVCLVVRRLADTLTRRARVAEAVGKLGHRALTVTEPDELLIQALHTAVGLLGTDYGTALRRMSDGRMRVAAELGPHPIAAGTVLTLAEAGSYAEHVTTSREPFISADLSRDGRVTPPHSLLRRGVVSGLAVPVMGARQTLGVLALHCRRRRHFKADEVAAATALAGVVATAWEHAALRARISHAAMHDPLTDLPNRALFLDRLEQALTRRSNDEDGSVTLMLIDLDDFKAVNDRLGHDAGDELLRAVAGRLLGVLRPEDTVARLGGDEFAVLCEQSLDERAAAGLVRRVQAAVADPLMLENTPLTVTASVGVTLGTGSTSFASTARGMLREADTALYTAKSEGRGRSRIYDERLQLQSRNRHQLESELRRGIDRHEFVLHYQPIRSTVDLEVLGVEALVRWQHPHRGLIPPHEFIPIAEETGLIVPLGQWVLETAAAQAAEWQRERPRTGRDEIWVAVNVSPRQLHDSDLPRQVSSAIERSGIVEGSLRLEFTELALLDGGTTGKRALHALRRAGAQLVLDDFGTGYSSLTHLRRYPIDGLKVDRSSMESFGRNTREAAVVSAVIALGAELGVDVIAEGVETSDQLSALQQTGCYGVQGFLLDHPTPSPRLGPASRVPSA